MLFHNLSNFLALLQLNTVLRGGLLERERERERGDRHTGCNALSFRRAPYQTLDRLLRRFITLKRGVIIYISFLL